MERGIDVTDTRENYVRYSGRIILERRTDRNDLNVNFKYFKYRKNFNLEKFKSIEKKRALHIFRDIKEDFFSSLRRHPALISIMSDESF